MARDDRAELWLQPRHVRACPRPSRPLSGAGRSRGGTVSLGTIRKILSELVRDELAATATRIGGRHARELVVQYVVGAYMAVMTWWLAWRETAAPAN